MWEALIVVAVYAAFMAWMGWLAKTGYDKVKKQRQALHDKEIAFMRRGTKLRVIK